VINTLDPKKAWGYDDLSVRLLKDAKDFVCEPIAHVLNLSLTTGIFPNKLKVARVVPIFKKGDRKLPGNYRPISILPIISKVYEKIVNGRLLKFLEDNSLFYEHQYGFRHGYSTKLSLINLINQITKYTDEGRMTVGIFIDFAKAFDTIDHSILLKKLEHYGIRGVPLDWFKDYLTNRQQFVNYDSAQSFNESLSCGVPQGSVLGPTLFLMYINDLPNSSKYFNFRLFADDSSLFHTFNSDERHVDLTEVCMNMKDIIKWCNANKLTINVNKTKYILFQNKRRHFVISGQLIINENILESVDSTSFLGIIIDKNLTWKTHVYKVCNTVSKKIGILYRIRHFVSRKVLVMLYNAFILPHMTYGLEVWGAANKTNLNSVLILQKRIARVLAFKDYRHPSAPLFLELKLLDIYKQYRYMICVFMHDLINNNLPHRFTDYFSFINHPYETRTKSKCNINVTKFQTNVGKQSISYSGPDLWNQLPISLRQNKKRKSFCNALKQYYLQI